MNGGPLLRSSIAEIGFLDSNRQGILFFVTGYHSFLEFPIFAGICTIRISAWRGE